MDFEKIAREIGTPAYVLDLSRAKNNIDMINKSINYPNFQVHYAMFCNDNSQLLRFVKSQRLGVLVLNEDELKTALTFGFPREKIHLTGGTFTESQIKHLLNQEIDVNLDSLKQIELAVRIKPDSKVGVRVKLFEKNVVGAGEGIVLEEVGLARRIADKTGIKLVGLQTYIGTNTLNEKRYLDSAQKLVRLAKGMPDLRYINIGGGFGIPYSSKDRQFSWGRFGKEISKIFVNIPENKDNHIQLKIEPGRSIVGDAGYFLTRVIEVRQGNTLVVDAPYTNFARPFVYHTNHRVETLGKTGTKTQFKIRGCSINAKDYLSHPDFDGDSAMLPKDTGEGDVLCFRDVGAYSPVMQMDFLHYPKARTYVVEPKV
jgi:diaminopimelate decarboxylase